MQEIQEYINTLPETERESKLKEIMSQFEQPQQCPFCLMSENKIPTTRVYEDANFMAVLEINPSNPGHTLLFPKKHYDVLAQMEDVSELFNLANNVAKSVFESVKAEGTNILVNNGIVAGQMVPHVVVNVIPRFKDDKVRLGWEKTEVNDEEMNELAVEISKNLKNKVIKKEEKIEEKKIKVVKVSNGYSERVP